MADALKVLRDQFGLDEFRDKQQAVIERVLKRQHTLALLPTGYGKSLCYQVPSQVLPGLTIVVSPLIALMEDQISGLNRRGITNATVLNSTIDFEELKARVDGIRSGAYKMIYVAPERFESQRFREFISKRKVSLFVVDEAHCISQWGHDFRPQYRNLRAHILELKPDVVLGLTATATPSVAADIMHMLDLPNGSIIEGSFDRPNLSFHVQRTASAGEKDGILKALLKDGPTGPAIVYTSSRKETERVSEYLRREGLSTAHYHAGMNGHWRNKAQKQFETGKLHAIVCTVAFGMGVDKSDIRQVVHYNLPASLENYYQEAGRAGRDGKPALCTMMFQPKDISTQRWLLDRNYPTGVQVKTAFSYIRSNSGCSAEELRDNTGIPESPLNCALDLFKQLGIIGVRTDGALLDLTDGDTFHEIDTTLLERRKKADRARLDAIITFAEAKHCRRKGILQYFGQNSQNCTGCDVCGSQHNAFVGGRTSSPMYL